MIDVEDHYGLVGWVIERHFTDFLNRYPTISYDDLFQEGVIALIEAEEKYDPDYNTAFNTYATYWIQYRIDRFVSQNIRPVTFSAQTSYRDRATKHLEDPDDIQEELDINDRQLLELIEYRINTYHTEIDPTRALNRSLTTDIIPIMDLKQVFSGLDEENQEIMILRAEGKTLREIGDRVGLSHTTISNRLNKIKEEVFEG